MPARSGTSRSDTKAAHDPRSAPAGVPARRAAFELLRAVLHQGQPLDEALADSRRLAGLETRDRAFARLLTATCLRRLGQIDALIAGALNRPLKPQQSAGQDILRLGVAQLVFLKTPPHAAVGATVELARGPRLASVRGLINAVLRRLSREGAALATQHDAARLNTPDWLWQSWSDAYGPETARAIAQAHLEEPPLDLTVRADAHSWAGRLDAEPLPGGSLRLAAGTGDVARLAGYAEGVWWVQDAAAALPARLLGDVAGRRVIDLCAAPGGKSAQLAAAGAELTAVDMSKARLGRLRENLARLKLSAETIAADAAAWQPEAPVDAVLLDAPCSGTGTLRRHPDIARLKRPEDLKALICLQDRLLAAAVKMIKPGGLLVYAVCSLQPEEGPARIAKLLEETDRLARAPIDTAELNGLAELVTPEGDLRSLPCHLAELGGLDGFYACRLRVA